MSPAAIAITGMGSVSPLATTAPGLVAALHTDALGVRPAPWASSGGGLFAAVHPDFDPTAVVEARTADGVDPFVAFGISACDEALAAAGFGPGGSGRLDPVRTAVVDGTSMGGFYSLMAAQWAFDRGGPDATPRKTMLRVWSNMTAAQVCIRHDLHGPSLTVTTACASALDALGQAAAMIAAGTVDVALAGGTEGGAPAPDPATDGFVPVTSVAGRLLGMESPAADPARAVLPFDTARSGIVFGEGAAWFVLESAEHARARGAEPIAWFRGYGTSADGFHPSSPEPDGRWARRAMALAQERAGVAPSAVDLVVAHATGTPKGDLAEARALDATFVASAARPDVLVTSIKGHTGHTGASSGGMGLVAAVGALADQRVSATRGTSDLDPEIRFDVVLGAPRAAEIRTVQVNAFGFGGQSSSVVVSRDPGGT